MQWEADPVLERHRPTGRAHQRERLTDAPPATLIGRGTTTLFAALEVATGRITADACYSRHRNGDFLAFLKQVATKTADQILAKIDRRQHAEIATDPAC